MLSLLILIQDLIIKLTVLSATLSWQIERSQIADSFSEPGDAWNKRQRVENKGIKNRGTQCKIRSSQYHSTRMHYRG